MNHPLNKDARMLRTALPSAFLLLASPALAQDPHAGHAAQPPAQVEPAPQPQNDAGRTAMDHMGHEGHMSMATTREHAMTGLLGGYPAARDASGTSWQPDASEHSGAHTMAGEWMLMGHALLNGVS